MKEIEAFELIAEKIELFQAKKSTAIRVAIAGIQGVGKATFAKHLTDYLVAKGKKVAHVPIDGYQNVWDDFYDKKENPSKYYYDNAYHDLAYIEKVSMASQSEQPTYTKAIYDSKENAYISLPPIAISSDTIIITDGSFLHRRIFKDKWDLKIYLKCDFLVARSRGGRRDMERYGDLTTSEERFMKQFHKASHFHIKNDKPEQASHLVFNNTNGFDDLDLVKCK